MRWRSIPWKACKGGYRVCLGTLNLVLLCIAGIQALMIGSVLLVGTITTPRIVEDFLENQFRKQGVQITWSRAILDLTGKVRFEELTLLDESRENTLFTAEAALLDLDLSPILWRGPIQVETFFLREGAFYLPPELAEGSTKPFLEIAELKIRKDWNTLIIEEAQLRTQEILLLAQGTVRREAKTRGEGDPLNLSEIWRKTTVQLLPLLDQLQQVGSATVEIKFESQYAQEWSAFANLRIPKLQLDQPAKIELTHLEASASVSFANKQLLITSPRLETHDAVITTDAMTLSLLNPQLQILGDFQNLGPHLISQSAFELLGQLQVPGLGRFNTKLNASLGENFALVEPTLSVHDANQWLELTAFEQAPEGAHRLQFTYQGEPDAVLNAPLLLDGAIGQRTDFSPRTQITGSLYLNPDHSIQKVLFHLDAKQFRVKEAAFDEAHSRGFFDGQRLQVGPIRVFDHEGQHAEGYFIQDFTDTGFRIAASGAVKARLLDSLLPPFYVDLWKDIDPGVRPVQADVDVTGRWNQVDSLQAFVDIDARELAFRGLPVQRAQVFIWYAFGFVELIGLEALNEGLGPVGDIAFIFARPWNKSGDRILVDVSTIQPLETLPIIFGPETSVLAELMSFEQPPLTTLKGFVNYGPEATINNSIDLQIVSQSPGTFRRVAFDSIQLNVFQENNRNFIPLLQGNVKEGRISVLGEISDATNGEGWAADLWIDTDNLPLDTFKEILAELDPSPSLSRVEAEPEPLQLTGKVDLELEVRFDGVPWQSLAGGGTIRLEDANLGRIHLFGGLSRIFSSVGLNITSLSLDYLQSRVEFERETVRFPDLVLRGPALRIDAPGKLTLPTTFLDFKARAYLLDHEERNLQALIGSILSPLSFFLEVDVKGTYDAPIWRLTKNPFNLLRAPLKNPTEAAAPTLPENPLPPPQTPDKPTVDAPNEE